MLWKCWHVESSNMENSANLANSAVATDWERSVFIPIPKKGNAKKCSNYCTIALILHTRKVVLKILQAWIQQDMNHELPDIQARYRKGRETRHQIANIRSVLFSRSVVSDSLQPYGLQHTRPPCPSPTPRVYSNSCLLCQWCHSTISSSVVPFFSSLRSFPAPWSFPMRQLFASGGQSIGVSASTSAFLMNTQDWFPLGWTGWIALPSKGLSKVFSNTTVQNHEFFGAQLSL